MESERPLHAPWARSTVAIILLTIAAYFVTARLGLLLAIPPAYKASAVWPPSGIALAGILLWGNRVWPGIWFGAFLGNAADFFLSETGFSLGAHVSVAAAIATGSTLQALLGGWIVSKWIGRPNFIDRGMDVLKFVLAACCACLVASSIGVVSLVAAGLTNSSTAAFSWFTWWLGDAVGIVLLAPTILVWAHARASSREAWLEGTGLMAVLALVGYLAFADKFTTEAFAASLAFLTVPLIVLATFRFGRHGATASLLVFSGVAIWGTAQGRGPFVYASTAESLFSLQAFVGIISLTALALAAVLAERKSEERMKSMAIERFERAMSEIRTLQSLIPICAWCKKVRNDLGGWEQLELYVHRHFDASFTHGICPDCRGQAELQDDVLESWE